MYPGHVYKQILLCEEDIANIYQASRIIWRYIELYNPHYEALELNTLKDIIDTWNKSSEYTLYEGVKNAE